MSSEPLQSLVVWMTFINVFNEESAFLLCFNHCTLQHLSQKTEIIARYEAQLLVRDLRREVLLKEHDTLMPFLWHCGLILN